MTSWHLQQAAGVRLAPGPGMQCCCLVSCPKHSNCTARQLEGGAEEALQAADLATHPNRRWLQVRMEPSPHRLLCTEACADLGGHVKQAQGLCRRTQFFSGFKNYILLRVLYQCRRRALQSPEEYSAMPEIMKGKNVKRRELKPVLDGARELHCLLVIATCVCRHAQCIPYCQPQRGLRPAPG